MATWPNTAISTTHLDAGNDLPRLARADLKSAVDNINSISSMPAGDFVVIKFTGNVDRALSYIPGNFAWYPEMTTAYASGNNFIQFRANVRNNTATTSGYAMVLSQGRYEVSFIDSSNKYFANGTPYTGTAVTTLDAIPGTINDLGNVAVGQIKSGLGPTHAEVIGPGSGGNTSYFDVPSHLVMDADRVNTFANSGGFFGGSAGGSEGVPPGAANRPDIQYIKFQRISY
jgi:hypothetical protein